MLSTALGLQFNVNDLDARYEVVGSSDNYSFQYNLGLGSDIADFQGEPIQKSISLEGNYGFFDVRVFAVNDIGIRSAFVETGISISPPKFDNTFTFNNLRVTNLPRRADVGTVNVSQPQFEGDKLEVRSEYINKDAQISWELIPPFGHAKQGESVDSELLKDGLFEKFEITIENGEGSITIDDSTLDASAGLKQAISAGAPSEALSNYREFSLNLNESVFNDLDLDRIFGVKIVSHDSFGRTATGVLSGVNYEPNIEGFNYSLRGSDVSFSWFSNDTDFKRVSFKRLGVPSEIELVEPDNLQASIDHFRDMFFANQWNFGFGNYQSGDMITYSTPPQTGVFKCILTHESDKNRNPDNSSYWEFLREDKIAYDYRELNITNNQYSDSQTWGFSYYYSLQAYDGYGSSSILNLTEGGLIESGNLKSLTSEVKVSDLRFRERKDDLIFNWNVLDQDSNLVDLEQYRFALSNSDTPSILGISGSLFDSHTKEFLTGITEGQSSKISSVDSDGNRSVIFDLPTTKIIDSFEYTRELNNRIYGVGGFVSNFEVFDINNNYNSGDFVADLNKDIYKFGTENPNDLGIPMFNNPKPSYAKWDPSKTYSWQGGLDKHFQYEGGVYDTQKPYSHLDGTFGPNSSNTKGVFDSRLSYSEGDFVISSDDQIFSYSSMQEYFAGDIVLHYQTFYLCLRDQDKTQSFPPGTDRTRWRVMSLFEEVPCSIFKVGANISVGDGSFDPFSPGIVGQINTTENYIYYCFASDNWGRIPIIKEIRGYGAVGEIECDSNFLYINISGQTWGKVALHDSSSVDDGSASVCEIQPDYHFIQVYTSLGWKKAPLSHWDFNGFSPSIDVTHWTKQTPENNEWFSLLHSAYKLDTYNWSSEKTYTPGSLVLYNNDIWSGLITSSSTPPVQGEGFWANIDEGGGDIYPSGYNQNDVVFHNGSLYYASENNPTGGPLDASIGSGQYVNSTFQESQWIPFWLRDDSYDDFVFGHIGIPESGKRSVGIEVGIIDKDGAVLNSERIVGINQEPSIQSNGFKVDSTGEVTRVKFNFNYAFSTQEKTTKVHLYRSSSEDFEITGSDGKPYDFVDEDSDSTLVKVTLGASDASFGQNVTQIVDEPPIPRINGADQPTGYFYKILPFDDFGSGDLYGALNNTEDLQKVIVWPKSYNNQNPNGPLGPVFRTSKDNIPGPVVNFSGDTAFENYFLNWSHPNSEVQYQGQIPNDLSHYEVWMSEDEKLELGSLGSEVYLKSEANPTLPIDFSNNSGYRRIEGDIPSYVEGFGAIPIERQDPALGITNAKSIFNEQVNGSEVSTSYFGDTNDTKYFWVRPVDFAGNKGPFAGRPSPPGEMYVLGLELKLGEASATDISDFEVRMTEKFTNTISLVPNNPFYQEGTSNQIKWDGHKLYFQGLEYIIDPGETDPTKSSGYIWWNKGEPYYNFSENHPAGSEGQDLIQGFGDGDFIVARNELGVVTPVYYSFANALIGTANIANAAIVDAKINDLKVDKLTAGTIDGHDIQVTQSAGKQGGIRTAGFYDINDASVNKGFFLSGDGSFGFKTPGGTLGFQDGLLTLQGRIKQTDGSDFDIGSLQAIPSYVNYEEINNSHQMVNSSDIIISGSLRSSSASTTDIQFRADLISENQNHKIFSYDQFDNAYNVNTQEYSGPTLSGFSYDIDDFEIDGSNRNFKAYLKAGVGAEVGFDDIIQSFNTTGDSVVVYARSKTSAIENSVTITRIIDGKIGINGNPGVDGKMGASPTYRGDFSPNGAYFFIAGTINEPGRGDIVKYSSDYYVCLQSNGGSNGSTQTPSSSSTFWKPFGAVFSSVATKLLVTEQSFVEDRIVLGDSSGGFIASNGFIGGLYNYSTQEAPDQESYATAGFLLGRDSSNKVFFDVGGPIKDDNGNSITGSESYLRFNSDTGKIEIKGSFTNNSSEETVNALAQNNNDPDDTLATFIGGGYSNIIQENVGVSSNYKSLASSIVAGAKNQIKGRFSFIGNGYENKCLDNFSSVIGGYKNEINASPGEESNVTDSTKQGGGNFIGGGKENSISDGSCQSIIGGSYNVIR